MDDFSVDSSSFSEPNNYKLFIGKRLCKKKFGIVEKVLNILMSLESLVAITFFR